MSVSPNWSAGKQLFVNLLEIVGGRDARRWQVVNLHKEFKMGNFSTDLGVNISDNLKTSTTAYKEAVLGAGSQLGGSKRLLLEAIALGDESQIRTFVDKVNNSRVAAYGGIKLPKGLRKGSLDNLIQYIGMKYDSALKLFEMLQQIMSKSFETIMNLIRRIGGR